MSRATSIGALPAAGYRNGFSVNSVGDAGDYWSSTALDGSRAYYVDFYSDEVDPVCYGSRGDGCGVRLITESN